MSHCEVAMLFMLLILLLTIITSTSVPQLARQLTFDKSSLNNQITLPQSFAPTDMTIIPTYLGCYQFVAISYNPWSQMYWGYYAYNPRCKEIDIYWYEEKDEPAPKPDEGGNWWDWDDDDLPGWLTTKPQRK